MTTTTKTDPIADPVAEYDAIKAMNWSSLKHMAVSPKLFKWRLDHPAPDKPAYDFGRAFHMATIEPARFADFYAVEPDFGDCRKTANRAERDDWRRANAACEIVSAANMEAVKGMGEAIRAHKVAGPLVREIRVSEFVITWTDEMTGLACKARVDLLGRDYLVDLKSTIDPSPRRFCRSVAEYLTHGQLAFYFDGAIASGALPKDAQLPYLIACEKTAPFDVAVYRASGFALQAGRELYRSLLRRFVECEAAGWYPGCAPGLLSLDLPEWAAGVDEIGKTDPTKTTDF